ncbi:DNA primase [Pseudopontixanthobacter vadosimaris]|uniref:DNA primase n=1 Tax=Pseudopontixanthobacter vadosimaris TaxID=2726450 RepID=UPI001475CAAD|nr:DNA primase [Pseudopontixanthobacter vadosimaris]
MALSPQWLDELRARISLSSLIGRTVRLQKAGHEHKACCPFHDEKSPSFTVSDQKGFYHCFGCGAHGDAIRWMTDQRGLPFIDAVKELASEAGLEMPAPDPQAMQAAERRAGLHDVTQAAQEWFAAQLQSDAGSAAREYLAGRGFDAHTAARFGFGYAPADRQALQQALGQFDEKELIEAGLRVAVEGKPPYDRFRDRLMLPIQDQRGRVIGFGGRILQSGSDAPKYLNSPDTPLFDKGRSLYNLHRAGPASRQTGRMIVVEGYMDVVALAAAGIEDAVAPMGTAVTEQQIELLWRQVPRPILCFDGDAAGQRAAMRAATRALPMLRPSHSLSIVTLPAGKDPDDLLKEKGRAALEDLLAAPASLLDMLWQHERDAQPLHSPEDKAGLKARLLAHVEAIGDTDIAALYRRELLERFSAFAFPPRERRPWVKNSSAAPFQRGVFRKAPDPVLSPEASQRLRRMSEGGSRDGLAAAVIAGLMRHPAEVMRHADALSRYAASDARIAPVVDSLLDAAEALEPGRTSPISDGESQAAPPEDTRFSFLVEGTEPQVAREDLAEAVSLLVERPALEAALAAATARFETDPEGAFAEQQRLLKRKLAFEKRLGQMASNRAARVAQDNSEPVPAQGDALTGQVTD